MNCVLYENTILNTDKISHIEIEETSVPGMVFVGKKYEIVVWMDGKKYHLRTVTDKNKAQEIIRDLFEKIKKEEKEAGEPNTTDIS